MVDPIKLGWDVERPAKERVEAIARRLGVSSAVFFEEMAKNVELDGRGVPVWWTRALPQTDEELPINPD